MSCIFGMRKKTHIISKQFLIDRNKLDSCWLVKQPDVAANQANENDHSRPKVII